MKTIGIVAHSAEGGGLCFLAACRAASGRLGDGMHPTIAMSAVPMALSMPGWRTQNHAEVMPHLLEGIRMVAMAGADFFICPDNTAHIVLDQMAGWFPLAGLHIADVVCAEIERHRWRRVGLLGTVWTMTGPVYKRALGERGMERLVPDEQEQEVLDSAIFEELCNGRFEPETTAPFLKAIERLKARGAECVILGCTEIPIVVNDLNSALPVLDSTRLLAQGAVEVALQDSPLEVRDGWIRVPDMR